MLILAVRAGAWWPHHYTWTVPTPPRVLEEGFQEDLGLGTVGTSSRAGACSKAEWMEHPRGCHGQPLNNNLHPVMPSLPQRHLQCSAGISSHSLAGTWEARGTGMQGLRAQGCRDQTHRGAGSWECKNQDMPMFCREETPWGGSFCNGMRSPMKGIWEGSIDPLAEESPGGTPQQALDTERSLEAWGTSRKGVG